jgi:hypothetical protein
MAKDWMGVDDKTFATAFVSLFMQIMGILQLPIFLGSSFTPFSFAHLLSTTRWSNFKSTTEHNKETTKEDEIQGSNQLEVDTHDTKQKRKRRKNQKANGGKEKEL